MRKERRSPTYSAATVAERLTDSLAALGRRMPPSNPKTRAEEIALLERRIDESGLSIRAFAREVLLRDDRTLRRWLAGDNPIPQIVMDFLEEPRPAPWP